MSIENDDDRALNDDEVAAYLKAHPDFLIRNQDVVNVLSPPGRWDGEDGGGVVDMQQFMLEQLRSESENLRDAARHIIDTSRANLSIQTRVHTAVLTLLGARDLPGLARRVIRDILLPLDVDAAVLAFESGSGAAFETTASGTRRLAPGYVDAVMGPEADVCLLADVREVSGLFGDNSPFIRSAALARLRQGPEVPMGLLGLGSRGAGTYHPGQGTELLSFLGRVVESLAYRFLE